MGEDCRGRIFGPYSQLLVLCSASRLLILLKTFRSSFQGVSVCPEFDEGTTGAAKNFPFMLSVSKHSLGFTRIGLITDPQKPAHSSRGQSGMHAVTVISTRRSGEFNITSTVVLAGLLVGKNLPYSSL